MQNLWSYWLNCSLKSRKIFIKSTCCWMIMTLWISIRCSIKWSSTHKFIFLKRSRIWTTKTTIWMLIFFIIFWSFWSWSMSTIYFKVSNLSIFVLPFLILVFTLKLVVNGAPNIFKLAFASIFNLDSDSSDFPVF